MLDAIVAYSDEIDTEDAAAAVLAECDGRLAGRRPSAGLLFCAAEYDHRLLLAAVNRRFPGLPLIGCTTDGEVSSTGGFSEDAVSLTLLCAEEVEFAVGWADNAGAEPAEAARQAALQAYRQLNSPPRLALTLPDGLTASAHRVLEGFTGVLGDKVPVVGGMSADRVGGSKTDFTTYQFCGDRLLQDSVPVLLLAGPLMCSLGVASGWSPIGRKMTVTRADDQVLHELDGRPAFELYTHYLGEVMNESLAGIGSYPLAVFEPGSEHFYLRVARHADADNGTVSFLGEVPEGAQVQITQAIRDSVLEGAARSAATAAAQYPGTRPELAMLFSCTGRKIALGTRTCEEVDRARAALAEDLPVCGFYTFGEIGPVTEHTRARYHNTTFVTLLLGTG